MYRLFWAFILCLITCFKLAAVDPALPLVENSKELENRFIEELKNQEAQGDDRFLGEFFYMLFVLAILVGMIFAISWFMKRMITSRIHQMNVTNSIKVLEQRGLNAKSSLYLIEVNGKGLIIGESVNGITRLGEVDLRDSPLLPGK